MRASLSFLFILALATLGFAAPAPMFVRIDEPGRMVASSPEPVADPFVDPFVEPSPPPLVDPLVETSPEAVADPVAAS